MNDLISRQDAKDAIDMALDHIDHVPPWVYDNLLNALNEVPSVKPTHSTPSNTLGALDCVSRQAAIDAIDEISREVDDGYGFDYAKWRQYFCELPPVLGTNLAEVGTDCISRQAGIMDAESWVAADEYEKNLQKKVVEWLKEFPSAQPEIIRCRDCKYNATSKKCLNPNSFFLVPTDDDFCSYAERKEQDDG